MAPPPGEYFPSLDDCLSRETQLISWKAAFLRVLSSVSEGDVCHNLLAFLRSAGAVSALSNPFDPFPKPSDQTKTEFESKTAAINVANKSTATINLDEIKKDATWLSEKARVDEISALRVVILEWQNRPAQLLLNKYSQEETNSLRHAVEAGSLSNSDDITEAAGIVAYTTAQTADSTNSDPHEVRKATLFQILLSEKLHLLKLSQFLLSLTISEAWPSYEDSGGRNARQSNAPARQELVEVAGQIFGADQGGGGKANDGTPIQRCIDAVRCRLQSLEVGSGWSQKSPDPEMEKTWVENIFDELYQVTQILFLRLQASSAIPSSEQLYTWLRLMADYEFLELIQPITEEQTAVFGALQSLISITTLAFLKLQAVRRHFDLAATHPPTRLASPPLIPSILSVHNIGDINELFIRVAQANIKTALPALFAWGLIMLPLGELALAIKEERDRQEADRAFDSYNSGHASSVHNTEPTIYENLWEKAHCPAFPDNFVDFFTDTAINKCRLFSLTPALLHQLEFVSGAGETGFIARLARVELLGLNSSGVEYLDYVQDLVSSTLDLITRTQRYSGCADTSPLEGKADPRAAFLRDATLRARFFSTAKTRFPYESVWFLQFCRALSGCHLGAEDGLPFVANQLQNMETYAQRVEPGFQDYRPTREDENANWVTLIQPLTMREVLSAGQTRRHEPSKDLVPASEISIVPTSTLGQVMNETKPAVIMWHHRYNCLSFLGKWLEQTTSASCGPSEEIVTEIIGLLADLITSADQLSRSNGVPSSAKRILEMASDGLDHYGDIISVVSDIFERYLHDIGGQPGPNRSLGPLISCVNFINALVKVIPGRVWPFLARSSLLASDGKGGMLASIISGVEASSGDFSFLLGAIRLFQSLVNDAVTHAALRRTAGRISARSCHAADFTAGVPTYVIRDSLLSMLRTLVEVYNSNHSWRFHDPEQQLLINAQLTAVSRDVIYYVYGISDDPDLAAKITGVLSTSAQYLLNVLRPASNAGLPFNPMLRIILNGIKTPMSTTNLRQLMLKTRLVRSALCLAETLIQAGSLTKSPLSPLEKQLFNASPILIRLFVLGTDYRLPVVSLLDLLVSYASLESEQEPPSLLGYLGAESSCRLLDVLSNFDKPFRDVSLRVAIWDLMATIVSKRQQWLAAYILTGSSPRDILKSADKKDGPVMGRRPFLATSLDVLSAIDSTPLHVSAAALNFVAKAQEHWPPWVKPELRRHQHFFQKTVNYVAGLKLRGKPPADQCLNTKIAYLLADICAISLHSAKDDWDRTFFKTLIPLVAWFAENAVPVDGYNASLHANLKKNFGMKYPACDIFEIKRTSLERRPLGDHYFFDLGLGDRLFSYDFAWDSSGKQGFREEMKRANLNLSLVETQVALLNSFKFFAIEHCAFFMPDRDVQKTMARVVRNCLAANSQGVPNETIFQTVQQVRADLALGLLQRLVDVKSRGSEVFGILSVAWEAAVSRHPTYESALVNNDMEYYGSLLNMIFLALQFHVAGAHRSDPEALSKKPEISSDLSIVLEVVKAIVAQGFRSLTIYLHEEPQRCSPKDFAILTAILQTALKVKDVDRIYEQLAFHLAESDAIRYAVALFSWAHQLTVEGDPVYGELSVLYLLELSCIPMLAEQMAAEGVLAKLSTYRLMDALRHPQGCGVFDPVPRLFSIWNGGLLRLCLNLLFYVSRTAPEVAAFLNQFDGQLRRASEAFSIGHAPATKSLPASRNLLAASQQAAGISLGMASEACSLALISAILRKFREAGPSAGVDSQSIRELKWDGAQVKDDIEVLLEKRSVLRSRITPTNEQEVAWLEKGSTDASSGAQSLLEEKIVKELKAALLCIDGGEGQ